ncbi:hypothetical protein M569_01234 [Genlisea aurea]|uniref:Uncharacterized protein n=1 Tax=Genlisea aurea TaxID=192259 RepID=S8D7S8_9LAMI|nr:hypothetical protein M569_01234 [Genlisea aurea]
MEELFQYMKTLRSQINDVADQTEKLSVEEHMNCTTIEALQIDLDLANEATRLFKEETARTTQVKSQIRLQILKKLKRIASLQSESRTLSQTLELMQQERISLSKKLEDKSAHYNKVSEDISEQLRRQQELIKPQNVAPQMEEGLVKDKIDSGKDHMEMDVCCDQAKIDEMLQQIKEKTVQENNEVPLLLPLLVNDKKREVMDERMLEEELQAVVSCKDKEVKSLESMQHEIRRLKEFSCAMRCCSCGEENSNQC